MSSKHVCVYWSRNGAVSLLPHFSNLSPSYNLAIFYWIRDYKRRANHLTKESYSCVFYQSSIPCLFQVAQSWFSRSMTPDLSKIWVLSEGSDYPSLDCLDPGYSSLDDWNLYCFHHFILTLYTRCVTEVTSRTEISPRFPALARFLSMFTRIGKLRYCNRPDDAICKSLG